MRELDPKIAEYWLSKPPVVRALADLPRASTARQDVAAELARSGALIDFALDVYGAHPYAVNMERLEMGRTTVAAWHPSGMLQDRIPVTLTWAPFPEANPSPVFIRRDTQEGTVVPGRVWPSGAPRASVENAEYWLRPGVKLNTGATHREVRYVGYDGAMPSPKAELLFSLVQPFGPDEGAYWKVTRVDPVYETAEANSTTNSTPMRSLGNT